ncbi:BolA-like protein 3 [Liparis tanakae]|uniref:BolA-like protein 3 n=1 Tax=Liparis tanakae TaxID=230148 RepID=A0A4Z2EMZ6_9TELE|nr:BolA-like protein 3 [Liparis tanakae]
MEKEEICTYVLIKTRVSVCFLKPGCPRDSESNEFKGKRTVQQHTRVNEALKEEIQGMDGLRIFTDVPKH